MTRKDYTKLAEALGVVFGQHTDGTPERAEFAADVLEVIADALKNNNENFDRARFAFAVENQARATSVKYLAGL